MKRAEAVRPERHPAAWLAWLAAAALPALLTRNPLYLSLVLLAAGVTYLSFGDRDPAARSWAAFVRVGAFLWLLTIPFTLLTSHHGQLVLARLPATWPVVGGPLTGEALLYGLGSGLAIVSLLLVFAVFNLAVDQARLLRMTPGFMYQAGLITAIAVAFVPQMVAAWQDIRQAQELRGHRVRGLRDLLPLIMPLLITALERAMQLAESMEARGFGAELAAESSPGRGETPLPPPEVPAPRAATARQAQSRRILQMLATVGGLAALGVGFAGLGFFPDRPLLLAALLGGGSLALLASFWDQGRHRRPRSHYRRWQWSRQDRLVLATSLAAVLGWLAIWLGRGDWLFYYPYPPYSPWPVFQPLLALLIALLAVPGLLAYD